MGQLGVKVMVYYLSRHSERAFWCLAIKNKVKTLAESHKNSVIKIRSTYF